MLDLYQVAIVFLTSKSNFDFVVDIVQVLAGIATVIALFFIWSTFRHERDKQQTQLAGDLFRDIRQLEQEFMSIEPDGNKEKLDQWYSRFFNTLEWSSFLINKRKISDKETVKFFAPLIKGAYEHFYMDERRLERDPDKPDDYPEFKKLYQKIKSI